MSYAFYHFLHLSSLFALALVLGSLWGLYIKNPPNKKLRKLLLGLHGLIMFLILLAGFGLMAKSQVASFPWPYWIYGKLAVWLALASSPVVLRKAGVKFQNKPRLYFLILLFLYALLFLALLAVKMKW